MLLLASYSCPYQHVFDASQLEHHTCSLRSQSKLSSSILRLWASSPTRSACRMFLITSYPTHRYPSCGHHHPPARPATCGHFSHHKSYPLHRLLHQCFQSKDMLINTTQHRAKHHTESCQTRSCRMLHKHANRMRRIYNNNV